jgi:hypothetical protein
MKTIWKYYVKEWINFIPQNAEFLSCGFDANGDACVWFKVDTENKKEEMDLFVVGTGWDISGIETSIYLGSFTATLYVWHVYAYFPNREGGKNAYLTDEAINDLRMAVKHDELTEDMVFNVILREKKQKEAAAYGVAAQ